MKRCNSKRQKYLIVVEKAGNNYSAYLPDIPGCIATGKTAEEARENIKDALLFHIEGILEDGECKPRAKAHIGYATV